MPSAFEGSLVERGPSGVCVGGRLCLGTGKAAVIVFSFCPSLAWSGGVSEQTGGRESTSVSESQGQGHGEFPNS